LERILPHTLADSCVRDKVRRHRRAAEKDREPKSDAIAQTSRPAEDIKRVTHLEGLEAVYPPPGDNIECVTLDTRLPEPLTDAKPKVRQTA
jgi:hypothetical protein